MSAPRDRQSYDKHTIEDYTQYIDKSSGNVLLFPSTYSRHYGYLLNRIPKNIKYEVISYRRPSTLNKSNSSEMVDKLWNDEISSYKEADIEYKKYIVNRNLGLLEKKRNNKTISKVFKTYNEAFTYQSYFGKGDIYTLMDNNDSKLYILCISKEEELINGFYPIKDLIYDIRSLINYNTYMKLVQNGIIPVGIKTDSILIENGHRKIVKLFDFSNKIGCFKIETDKWLNDIHITHKKNKYLPIDNINPTNHHIKD